MTSMLVDVKHNEATLLLWVLLLLGTSLAPQAAHDTTPTTVGNQETAASPCVTPPCSQVDSAPLAVRHQKPPAPGLYIISDHTAVCLKAHMGVQYMVTRSKKVSYFNIDPTSTKATGLCGQNTSYLSLNFTGGHLQFTIHKEENVAYVTTVRASLEMSPACKDCKSDLFTGVISNQTLFQAAAGLCYRCNALTTLQVAEDLSIRIIHLQIQAFEIIDGQFGLEEECWPDYYRRVVPMVLGAVAVGIWLIVILAFLLIRDNHPQGYERL
ncbi:hypothetical protein AAFF_G00003360 [Aldrovandia affinis]|uniref:Lysosome-associated membrane glycoprotein 2-like luminal domain-containing protein n=1 Tax=Aldrovandia affinis TaxID=143900 RepID=A0AAD7TDW8_9TELE|nr:hypothetical protein AAFF_G00003360 [Aldrovandia affinis]